MAHRFVFIYRVIWQQVFKREQVSNPFWLVAVLITKFPKGLTLVQQKYSTTQNNSTEKSNNGTVVGSGNICKSASVAWFFQWWLWNFLNSIYLFGPLIFTIVNTKRRRAITSSVSYKLDSCPFILVIAFLPDHYYARYSGSTSV